MKINCKISHQSYNKDIVDECLPWAPFTSQLRLTSVGVEFEKDHKADWIDNRNVFHRNWKEWPRKNMYLDLIAVQISAFKKKERVFFPIRFPCWFSAERQRYIVAVNASLGGVRRPERTALQCQMGHSAAHPEHCHPPHHLCLRTLFSNDSKFKDHRLHFNLFAFNFCLPLGKKKYFHPCYTHPFN